jgi:hypothetical protein
MRNEGSTREQARLYLEWAECARRDAVRAIGRDARNTYLAAAEKWDERAVDIKRNLWRDTGLKTPHRSQATSHPIPKIDLATCALNETERYKREAKRPRTPGPAVPIRSPQRIAPAEYC